MYYLHLFMKLPIEHRQLAYLIFLLSALSLNTAHSVQLDSNDGVPRPLTLNEAIELALANDSGLRGKLSKQRAFEAKAIAAKSLPDPKLKVGIVNLAADSLEFNQEAMTQFKIGIRQQLPKGNSLELQQKQFLQFSKTVAYEKVERYAQIALRVRNLWLNTYQAQESLSIIADSRPLFEQLTQIAQSKYTSAVGRTHQQDVVRADLELIRIDDKAVLLKQQKETAFAQLLQWIDPLQANNERQVVRPTAFARSVHKDLPDLVRMQPGGKQNILTQLSKHPSIQAIETKIAASQTAVELTEQAYKPQLAVSVDYGYREEADYGIERDDFISVGVEIDVPYFNSRRQDKRLKAAYAEAEFVKTEKTLRLRELYSIYTLGEAKLLRLTERKRLYETRLLPQMYQQSEAALNAYTNDVGDFAEVMRSRVAELNAQIDFLAIQVEQAKTAATLHYVFTNTDRPQGTPHIFKHFSEGAPHE